MVLSSGNKFARQSSSISNRTNTEGGSKKAGTAPTVGFFLSSNPTLRRVQKSVPPTMVDFGITQNQRTGYRATLGM